jgi:L-ascorbate metabolism protein UlaG (beta-lactamase superfamily)
MSTSWAAELLGTTIPPVGVQLTWLGQSGFLLRGGGTAVLVDPFLSDFPDRLVPPADRPAAFRGIDAVFATHEHADHLDADVWPELAAASPQARFVLPEPLVPVVRERFPGLARRVVGVQPGDDVTLPDSHVRVMAACHAVNADNGFGSGATKAHRSARFVGYLFELGGIKVYHAGDTLDFAGLDESLRDLAADVLLLPVNGRDEARARLGIVGNMDADEAVSLAVRAGARILVPMHYDMFEVNQGQPARCAERLVREPGDLALLHCAHFRPILVG